MQEYITIRLSQSNQRLPTWTPQNYY
ncbi:hypothetical protein NC652_011668 [Populus alba x Populus x berolinensis]|uniref:Uncharacterized protein n=1 Tax=Populus alba x Populus x berolinensis TaxID=444605 RepID=A0AAD6R460_9ROSI|nr:hypothetical protein NC652_011668 [Populus alba x Populus x berolinensis]KAJ7001405.1 hypothetical protein NC653_011737 [Populus alba x Populus x berolinensis]